MPDRTNRIGIVFDVRGGQQFTRQIKRAVEANVSYGKTLPVQQMRSYNAELRNIQSSVSRSENATKSFSSDLVRVELSAKQARLGFTQFRRSLNTNELRRYGVEIGQLDHLLGSTGRSLRFVNQRLADGRLNERDISRFSGVLQTHQRTLSSVRGNLTNAFDTKPANNYINSLESIDTQMQRLLSTTLAIRAESSNVAGLSKNFRRLASDLDFPVRGRQSRVSQGIIGTFQSLRQQIDRTLFNQRNDAISIIDRNLARTKDLNRSLQPVQDRLAISQARFRLITEGSAATLRNIEAQIAAESQLAALGNTNAQRRVRNLTRQRDFINTNIQIRERELLINSELFQQENRRVSLERLHIDLENRQLQQYGLQRTILQNIGSTVRNTVRTLIRNPILTQFVARGGDLSGALQFRGIGSAARQGAPLAGQLIGGVLGQSVAGLGVVFGTLAERVLSLSNTFGAAVARVGGEAVVGGTGALGGVISNLTAGGILGPLTGSLVTTLGNVVGTALASQLGQILVAQQITRAVAQSVSKAVRVSLGLEQGPSVLEGIIFGGRGQRFERAFGEIPSNLGASLAQIALNVGNLVRGAGGALFGAGRGLLGRGRQRFTQGLEGRRAGRFRDGLQFRDPETGRFISRDQATEFAKITSNVELLRELALSTRDAFSAIARFSLRTTNNIRAFNIDQVRDGVNRVRAGIQALPRSIGRFVSSLRDANTRADLINSAMRRIGGFAQSVSRNITNSTQASRQFESVIRIVQNPIRSIVSGFSRVFETIERTNLVMGNINVRTNNLVKSLGNLAFVSARNLVRTLQSSPRSLEGLIDNFRSVDSQVEKIDDRLRGLQRSLAVPTREIQEAQAAFNLSSAKVEQRLNTVNRRIRRIDESARRVEQLEDELSRITRDIAPILLDIQIQQQEIESAVAPLRRELEDITSEFELSDITFVDELGRRFNQQFNFSELREEFQRLSSELFDATTQSAPEETIETIQRNLEAVTRVYVPLSQRINTIRNSIDDIRDVEDQKLATLNDQLSNLRSQELVGRRRLLEESRLEDARVKRFQDTRDQLQDRLKDEKELFRTRQLGFNVLQAEARQEAVLLQNRRSALLDRRATGAGADTLSGSIGDLTRNIATQTGTQLPKLADITKNVSENARDIASNVGEIDFSGAIQQSQEFGNQILATNQASEELAGGLITRIRNQISVIRNDFGGFIRDVSGQAITVVQQTASATVRLSANIVKQGASLAIGLADNIARIPIRLLGIIPLVGEGVRDTIQIIYDLFAEFLSNVATIGVSIARRVSSIVSNIFFGILNIVRGIASQIGSAVSNIFLGLANNISQLVNVLATSTTNALTSVASTIASVYRQIFNTLVNIITGFIDTVIGYGSRIVKAIESIVQQVAQATVQLITIPINVVINLFRAGADIIVAPFKLLAVAVREIGRIIQDVIIHPFETLGTIVTAPFRALGFVLNALTFRNFNLGEQGQSAGREYREGVDEGVNQPIEPRKIPKFIRTVEAASPPKSGPFKEVPKWGEATGMAWGAGFVKGIEGIDLSQAAAKTRRDLGRSVLPQTGGQGVSAASSQTVFGRRQDPQSSLFAAQGRAARASADQFNVAGRAVEDFSQRATGAIRSISDIFRVLTSRGQSLGAAVTSLRTSFSNLSLGAVGALALVGGALAATLRAANFKGIILGFLQTGASLDTLRAAAAGTVDDIALMRSANLALAGATLEVRDALARDLPTILEIARGQAVRTGQSVSFLFESLTTGIKRASPRLIDNTGLVIRIGEAYNRMAERLGKSRDELTASETQLAILEETLRAGRKSIQELGRDTEGAGQKMERFRATVTNLVNRLAFGAQPALEGVLDIFNDFLLGLDKTAVAIGSAVFVTTRVFFKGINTFFRAVGRTTQTFLSNLITSAGINTANLATGVSDTLKNIFFGLVDVFGSVAGAVAGIWDVIVETIHSSLETIASFLIGESPPPAGPLQNIDKGGQAAFEAWQEGFVGGGVDEIEDFANDIGDAINNIFERTGIPAPSEILEDTFEEARRRFGSLSLDQLEKALERLDRAIVPFETRLEIIREHFDSIQEAAQTSLDAINRRIGTLLQAVAEGDEAAAAEVRRLDALFSRVQFGNALEQQRLDNAAISIGLLRAQQAEERALLEIEIARRREQEKSKADEDREFAQDVFPDPLSLGTPFSDVGFLAPGTEDLANEAIDRFNTAFNRARDFITGQAGPDTTVGLDTNQLRELGITFDPENPEDFYRALGGAPVGQTRGNIFERFFSGIPDAIQELPENVRKFFESFREKIIEFFDQPIFDKAEDFIEKLFGLEEGSVDFSVTAGNIYDFFAVTVPAEFVRLLNATGATLGIDKFVETVFNAKGFQLGTFLASLPETLLNLPGQIVKRWTDYVTDLNLREAEGDIPDNFIDRLVQALFNDDFTLDIGAALSVTWDYLTGDVSAGPGNSLRADISNEWDNRPTFSQILQDVGITGEDGILAATETLIVDLVIGVTDVAVSVVTGIAGALGIGGGQGGDAGSPQTETGQTFSIIRNAVLNALGLPFFLIRYVLTNPIDLIFNAENFVGELLGVEGFSFTTAFAGANTFLNTTLPNSITTAITSAETKVPIIRDIRDFFSDLTGNESFSFATLFENAYNAVNSLRQQIHTTVFGDDLTEPGERPAIIIETEVMSRFIVGPYTIIDERNAVLLASELSVPYFAARDIVAGTRIEVSSLFQVGPYQIEGEHNAASLSAELGLPYQKAADLVAGMMVELVSVFQVGPYTVIGERNAALLASELNVPYFKARDIVAGTDIELVSLFQVGPYEIEGERDAAELAAELGIPYYKAADIVAATMIDTMSVFQVGPYQVVGERNAVLLAAELSVPYFKAAEIVAGTMIDVASVFQVGSYQVIGERNAVILASELGVPYFKAADIVAGTRVEVSSLFQVGPYTIEGEHDAISLSEELGIPYRKAADLVAGTVVELISIFTVGPYTVVGERNAAVLASELNLPYFKARDIVAGTDIQIVSLFQVGPYTIQGERDAASLADELGIPYRKAADIIAETMIDLTSVFQVGPYTVIGERNAVVLASELSVPYFAAAEIVAGTRVEVSSLFQVGPYTIEGEANAASLAAELGLPYQKAADLVAGAMVELISVFTVGPYTVIGERNAVVLASELNLPYFKARDIVAGTDVQIVSLFQVGPYEIEGERDAAELAAELGIPYYKAADIIATTMIDTTSVFQVGPYQVVGERNAVLLAAELSVPYFKATEIVAGTMFDISSVFQVGPYTVIGERNAVVLASELNLPYFKARSIVAGTVIDIASVFQVGPYTIIDERNAVLLASELSVPYFAARDIVAGTRIEVSSLFQVGPYQIEGEHNAASLSAELGLPYQKAADLVAGMMVELVSVFQVGPYTVIGERNAALLASELNVPYFKARDIVAGTDIELVSLFQVGPYEIEGERNAAELAAELGIPYYKAADIVAATKIDTMSVFQVGPYQVVGERNAVLLAAELSVPYFKAAEIVGNTEINVEPPPSLFDSLRNIPTAISDFLALPENENLFNLRDILRAATGDEELTLQGVWDGFALEVAKFATNPFAYIGDTFFGFIEGIRLWAQDTNNPIVQAINSIGSLITGNPNFSVANVIDDILGIFDDISRDLRVAFGLASAEDIYSVTGDAGTAIPFADNQQVQSLGQAFLNVFQNIWDRATQFVNDNPGDFTIVDSFLQFISGNRELSVQGIVNGINEEIQRIREEGLAQISEGRGASQGTVIALDSLASLVFGRNIQTGEVPTILGDWVTGLPDRLITYFEENEERNFTGLLRAFLDDDTITPGDIIPNIISVIRQIPGAILDVLATTNLFGEQEAFLANTGETITADTILDGFIDPNLIGTRRTFTITPLFQGIFDTIGDQASAFFNVNPLGKAVTNAVRWFSGDEDFTFDNFAQGFIDLLTAESGEARNTIIQSHLDANPNLFGLDSLAQFFTGDKELTLASLFPQIVAFFGEGGGSNTLTGQLAQLFDRLTGNLNLGNVGLAGAAAAAGADASATIGFGRNIFQRLGDGITGAFQGVFDRIRNFFAEREAAGENFLGLDNLISALSGGTYTTVSEWLESFTGVADGAELEPIQNFPDLIERIFTAISNLFTTDIEVHDGEAGGPFAALFETLDFQFNSENEDSVAGRLVQFGDTLSTLFTETIPQAVNTLQEVILGLRSVLVSLADANIIPQPSFYADEKQRQELIEDVSQFVAGVQTGVFNEIEDDGFGPPSTRRVNVLELFFGKDFGAGFDFDSAQIDEETLKRIGNRVSASVFITLREAIVAGGISDEDRLLVDRAIESGIIDVSSVPLEVVDGVSFQSLLTRYQSLGADVALSIFSSIRSGLTFAQQSGGQTGGFSEGLYVPGLEDLLSGGESAGTRDSTFIGSIIPISSTDATVHGAEIGTSWQAAFAAGIGAPITEGQVSTLLATIKPAGSPPAEGPLSTIDEWGYSIGRAWLDGFNDAISEGVNLEQVVLDTSPVRIADIAGSEGQFQEYLGSLVQRSASGVDIQGELDNVFRNIVSTFASEEFQIGFETRLSTTPEYNASAVADQYFDLYNSINTINTQLQADLISQETALTALEKAFDSIITQPNISALTETGLLSEVGDGLYEFELATETSGRRIVRGIATGTLDQLYIQYGDFLGNYVPSLFNQKDRDISEVEAERDAAVNRFANVNTDFAVSLFEASNASIVRTNTNISSIFKAFQADTILGSFHSTQSSAEILRMSVENIIASLPSDVQETYNLWLADFNQRLIAFAGDETPTHAELNALVRELRTSLPVDTLLQTLSGGQSPTELKGLFFAAEEGAGLIYEVAVLQALDAYASQVGVDNLPIEEINALVQQSSEGQPEVPDIDEDSVATLVRGAEGRVGALYKLAQSQSIDLLLLGSAGISEGGSSNLASFFNLRDENFKLSPTQLDTIGTSATQLIQSVWNDGINSAQEDLPFSQTGLGLLAFDGLGLSQQDYTISDILPDGFTVEQAALDGAALGVSYRDALLLELNVPLETRDLSSLVSSISPAGSPPAEGPLSEIDEWGKAVGQAWVDGFKEPFASLFAEADEEGEGEGESGGAFDTILEQAYTRTQEFATNLPTAFEGLPGRIWDAMGSPMISIFNYLIDAYNDFISTINTSTASAADELGISPISVPGASRISTDRPGFLGAESGGTFGPGGLIVGERGPELIVPSQRVAIFPSQATRGLSQLGSLLQGQYQRPIYGTQNTYNTYNNSNDDHSTVFNVEGGGSSDSNRAVMEMKAYMMRRRR